MQTDDPSLYREQAEKLREFYSQRDHSKNQLAPNSGETSRGAQGLAELDTNSHDGNSDFQHVYHTTENNKKLHNGARVHVPVEGLGNRAGQLHRLRPDEMFQLVHIAKQQMQLWSDDVRTVVDMVHTQNKSVEEAAEVIGRSVGYTYRLLRAADDSLMGAVQAQHRE